MQELQEKERKHSDVIDELRGQYNRSRISSGKKDFSFDADSITPSWTQFIMCWPIGECPSRTIFIAYISNKWTEIRHEFLDNQIDEQIRQKKDFEAKYQRATETIAQLRREITDLQSKYNARYDC